MRSDAEWLGLAIEASRGGFPAPNPHVGCVLVSATGGLVATGYHDHAGAPHAEAMALQLAGEAARGCTAYVTLEPCNHFGRTPPCAQALIRAGVRRVVIACPDPNPKAAGGATTLREAGISVDWCEEMRSEAELANRQFLFAMKHRRPRVTLKAAASLDGRIALPSGESQWITGEEARSAGHRLRAECGAVLVGRRTVELDNPQLTARIEGVVNQPLRIVLDPQNSLSGKERVFDKEAPSRHVTGEIDLGGLLEDLFSGGVTGLLIEGGATTASAFVRAGLVDRFELFLAPKLLGTGPTWLGDIGLTQLELAQRGEIVSVERRGNDVQISVDLRAGESFSAD